MNKLSSLTSRSQLGQWLTDNGLTMFGAEVGVQYGRNAERIIDNWKVGCILFLIDPWKPQPHYIDGSAHIDMESAYNETIARLARHDRVGRSCVLRMTSLEAAKFLRGHGVTFDFIYIDAIHHEPEITQDLEAWWPLLRPGGLFGGHDYYNRDLRESDGRQVFLCQVKSAVDAFAEELFLPIHTTPDDPEGASWWIIKPDYEKGDR